jgi:tRNA-splicing ligase RtcB
MLHSGSRNVGNINAQHYDKIAHQVMKKKNLPEPAERGLNYMEIESSEGQQYLNDMHWCQLYAAENRKSMLDIMLEIVVKVKPKAIPDLDHMVNIHHNYCNCEEVKFKNKAGKFETRKLWVTRKGATSARHGELGIIPGSMGVGSYIVRGRGNSESWSSCSHGAGRRLSRTAAVKEIPQEVFEETMSSQGIVCDTHPGVRDEAPQAYKDLTMVMENQSSLVDVVYRLLPLVNVKGFETKIRNFGNKKKKFY